MWCSVLGEVDLCEPKKPHVFKHLLSTERGRQPNINKYMTSSGNSFHEQALMGKTMRQGQGKNEQDGSILAGLDIYGYMSLGFCSHPLKMYF